MNYNKIVFRYARYIIAADFTDEDGRSLTKYFARAHSEHWYAYMTKRRPS